MKHTQKITVSFAFATLFSCTMYTAEIKSTNQTIQENIAKLLALVKDVLENLTTRQTSAENLHNIYNFSDTRTQYKYEFEDQNVSAVPQNLIIQELKLIAATKNITFSMPSDEENNDTIFTSRPKHNAKIIFDAQQDHTIFVNISNATEFRRLPYHTFTISKPANNQSGVVLWSLFDNNRVLFSPIGYKTTLPEDPETHIVNGEYTDQNITFDGICLFDGPVVIMADTQDITVKLEKSVVFMNKNNDTESSVPDSLVLVANAGRKIKLIVDESMEWRSHLDFPFYVLQAGDGKVEIKIRAQDRE